MAAVCQIDGCTREAWSAGLCQVCYHRDRRHDGSVHECWNGTRAQNDAGTHNGCYDVRFTSLFRGELELRGYPHYPQRGWHQALARADYAYRDLRPLRPPPTGYGTGHYALPPEVAGVPEKGLYAGYGAYSAEGVLRSVDQACTRWLSARDV